MSSTTCTNDITKKLSLILTEELRKYPNPVKESCVQEGMLNVVTQKISARGQKFKDSKRI